MLWQFWFWGESLRHLRRNVSQPLLADLPELVPGPGGPRLAPDRKPFGREVMNLRECRRYYLLLCLTSWTRDCPGISSMPCFTAQSVSKPPRKEPDLRPRQTDRDPEPPVGRGNGHARSRILRSPGGAVRQARCFGSKG